MIICLDQWKVYWFLKHCWFLYLSQYLFGDTNVFCVWFLQTWMLDVAFL